MQDEEKTTPETPEEVLQQEEEAQAEPPATALRELLARMESAVPFGPSFFLRHLGAFVRDCCPDPSETLPFVHVHLSNSEVLDLCHVIGLAPRFVALAVYEGGTAAARPMRTELVPYETIARVTVRPGRGEGSHIGFSQDRAPVMQAAPEKDLELAATPHH